MTAVAISPSPVLLGPQAQQITLAGAVADTGVEGSIATITAGWQEREMEDADLDRELQGRSFNLRLYQRWDEVMEEDPALREGHLRLQTRLRELRRIYNARLDHAMQGWQRMMEWRGDRDLARGELDHALSAIRSLDDHHLERIAQLRTAFLEEFAPARRDAVRRRRDQVLSGLDGCGLVCIAGGHVAVLLNRIRLFDLTAALRERAVIAWSAGAMALTRRVVLFHDSPPQGPGHAEAFDHGLDLAPGVVALPDAEHRLRLDDRGRVSRMAQRFAPDVCVLLEAGSRVDGAGRRWRSEPGIRVLRPSGQVGERHRW